MMGLVSVLVAMGIIILLKNAGFTDVGQINDISAQILFTAGFTGIAIAAITVVINIIFFGCHDASQMYLYYP